MIPGEGQWPLSIWNDIEIDPDWRRESTGLAIRLFPLRPPTLTFGTLVDGADRFLFFVNTSPFCGEEGKFITSSDPGSI